MDWNKYVGEKFQGPNHLVYKIQSYDPKIGFTLTLISNPNKLFTIKEDCLRDYSLIINTNPIRLIKSIKDHEVGCELISRAILALEIDTPIPELVEMYRGYGYSHWDIYLTIRAAQVYLRGLK